MKNKKGISLIVLVIIIIVMIVLAGAIIITLNNSGIIDKANKAVDEMNVANVKAAADLIYMNYLLEKPQGVTDVGEYITNKLVEAGTISGKDKGYYVVIVDDETVVVKVGTTADKFYKGEIKVGDVINYVSTGTNYEKLTWRILGINKNNELQIVPQEEASASASQITLSLEDYPNIIEKLDSECEKYGKGKWATGARSITVEDINKVTGYDINSNNLNRGRIGEYLNKVTFYWDGTDKPYYTSSNGATGNLETSHTEFVWYDKGKGWQTSPMSTTATVINKEKIATIEITSWGYYKRADVLEENSNTALMIFGTEIWSGSYASEYFVADNSVTVSGGKIIYGVYKVSYLGDLGEWYLSSDLQVDGALKPVVTLQNNIAVTGNTIDGWSIVE